MEADSRPLEEKTPTLTLAKRFLARSQKHYRLPLKVGGTRFLVSSRSREDDLMFCFCAAYWGLATTSVFYLPTKSEQMSAMYISANRGSVFHHFTAVWLGSSTKTNLVTEKIMLWLNWSCCHKHNLRTSRHRQPKHRSK